MLVVLWSLLAPGVSCQGAELFVALGLVTILAAVSMLVRRIPYARPTPRKVRDEWGTRQCLEDTSLIFCEAEIGG